jgi:predicted nucleic acid-binding protein
MIQAIPTIVLDACVLYPAPVRDLLLSLAADGLFKPKWSTMIQEEWVRNLLKNRPDLKKETLLLTINAMNRAFPESNVKHFESLISGLELPDKDDRHVLACGIKCRADLILTFNKKDFPANEVLKYKIGIQDPDKFISNLIGQNEVLVCQAFAKMVNRLKNPPKTKPEVTTTLRNCGLILSAKQLEHLC